MNAELLVFLVRDWFIDGVVFQMPADYIASVYGRGSMSKGTQHSELN